MNQSYPTSQKYPSIPTPKAIAPAILQHLADGRVYEFGDIYAKMVAHFHLTGEQEGMTFPHACTSKNAPPHGSNVFYKYCNQTCIQLADSGFLERSGEFHNRKEYRITLRGLIEIPDPNLRSAVVSELGNSTEQITTADMSRLTSLESTRTTMSNLAGLESAINLNDLNLWGNAITDIFPLVANTGLDVGDYVDVRHNPLSKASINTHVPKLQQRGVKVRYHATQEPVQLRLSGACVGVGDTFTISLIADDVKDLASWEFWFNFSPKIFTVVSVNEGDLLKKDGGTTSFQAGSVEIRPDNTGGWIRDVRAVRKGDLLTKDGKTPFSIQRHLRRSLATSQPDNSDRFKKVRAVRDGNSVSGSGELVSITFVAKKAATGGLGGLQLGLYQENGAEIPWEVTSTGQVIVANSSRDVED